MVKMKMVKTMKMVMMKMLIKQFAITQMELDNNSLQVETTCCIILLEYSRVPVFITVY